MIRKIQFYKFHGAGNDFVIMDARKNEFQFSKDDISKICHRHFGVGADGLMLLFSSDMFDFRMQYFNADGREGSMCGNGGRCIVACAQILGIVDDCTTFEAVDGTHEANIHCRNQYTWNISLKLNNVNKIIKNEQDYVIDTGSPHYIQFVDDVEKLDTFAEGRRIRYDTSISEKGVNVNFVEERDGYIYVRTYERGVEDITLSCGTGVTASAIAFAMKEGLQHHEILTKTLGGDLKVSFEKKGESFTNIYLSGPAEFVFSGELLL